MALTFFLPFLFQKGLVGRVLTHAHALSNNKSRQMIMDIYFFFFQFLRAIPQFPLILEMCLIHLSICSDPCLSFEMDFVRVSFFLPFGLVDICLYVLLLTVLPRVVSVFFFFLPSSSYDALCITFRFIFLVLHTASSLLSSRFPTSGSIVI